MEEFASWPRRREQAKREAKASRVYASFNDRIYAATIDMVLLFIILSPLLVTFPDLTYNDERRLISAEILPGTPPVEMFHHMVDRGFFRFWFLELLLHYLLLFPFFWLCWSYASTTPGKWLYRLRIVDRSTFKQITPKQRIVRYGGYLATFLPFGLGFLWMLVDKKQRAVHDILSDTAVIRVRHWRIKDDGQTAHREL